MDPVKPGLVCGGFFLCCLSESHLIFLRTATVPHLDSPRGCARCYVPLIHPLGRWYNSIKLCFQHADLKSKRCLMPTEWIAVFVQAKKKKTQHVPPELSRNAVQNERRGRLAPSDEKWKLVDPTLRVPKARPADAIQTGSAGSRTIT